MQTVRVRRVRGRPKVFEHVAPFRKTASDPTGEQSERRGAAVTRYIGRRHGVRRDITRRAYYVNHLSRKGRGQDRHGAESQEVDQRQRRESHVLIDGEAQVAARARLVVVRLAAAAAAHVERHRAARHAAQFAERVPFHGQRHAAGVVELFRIIDAEPLDASSAPAGAAAVALDAIADAVGRDHVRVLRLPPRVLVVRRRPDYSYVLVVVRASVLLVHAHARGRNVVVGLLAACQ